MTNRVAITTVEQLLGLPHDMFMEALRKINQQYSSKVQNCYAVVDKDTFDNPSWGLFKENVDIADGLTFDFVTLLCRINEIK